MKRNNSVKYTIKPLYWRYYFICIIGIFSLFWGIKLGLFLHEGGINYFSLLLDIVGIVGVPGGIAAIYIAHRCKSRVEVSENGITITTEKGIHQIPFSEIESFGYKIESLREFFAFILKRKLELNLTRFDRLLMCVPQDLKGYHFDSSFDNAILLEVANAGERQIDRFLKVFRKNYVDLPSTNFDAILPTK